MLEFRDIDISDRQWIEELLRKSDFMGCEYSFANNMAWHRLNGSKITRYKDFYAVCAFDTDDGVPTYIFPSGEGDYREILSEMSAHSAALGHSLRLWGVTKSGLEILNELYPEKFTAVLSRDSSDYIYLRENLAELPGKKYHNKRNHLAKLEAYKWQYQRLTEEHFDDAISFATKSYNAKNGIDDHSSVAEQYAINTYFTYFNELELLGGIIRIDGEIAALTIGERLNSNTFCVHIEKADTKYNGIYVGINNCFVKDCMKEYTYVNREEDLGLDGLRRSKSSYYPEFLIEKHLVTFNKTV